MADDAFARLVRNAGSVTAVGDSAPYSLAVSTVVSLTRLINGIPVIVVLWI